MGVQTAWVFAGCLLRMAPVQRGSSPLAARMLVPDTWLLAEWQYALPAQHSASSPLFASHRHCRRCRCTSA